MSDTAYFFSCIFFFLRAVCAYVFVLLPQSWITTEFKAATCALVQTLE